MTHTMSMYASKDDLVRAVLEENERMRAVLQDVAAHFENTDAPLGIRARKVLKGEP